MFWLAAVCYFAGVGCNEGGGCNEVMMEAVMIKGDKDKTLFITYYTLIHTLFFISYVQQMDA